MKLNNVAKGINLIGTSVTELKIDNNLIDLGTDAKKSFGLSVHKPKKEVVGNSFFYTVRITIDVQIEKDDNVETKIKMDLEGAFEPEADIHEKDFETLVAINGVAALIGIARGKIEAISATLFYTGKISIPFVNVIEYYDEINNAKKKNM